MKYGKNEMGPDLDERGRGWDSWDQEWKGCWGWDSQHGRCWDGNWGRGRDSEQGRYGRRGRDKGRYRSGGRHRGRHGSWCRCWGHQGCPVVPQGQAGHSQTCTPWCIVNGLKKFEVLSPRCRRKPMRKKPDPCGS